LYIGVPAIINRDGIRKLIELPLNETEQEQFKNSAETLKQIINQTF